jgi:hypothetical protein
MLFSGKSISHHGQNITYHRGNDKKHGLKCRYLKCTRALESKYVRITTCLQLKNKWSKLILYIAVGYLYTQRMTAFSWFTCFNGRFRLLSPVYTNPCSALENRHCWEQNFDLGIGVPILYLLSLWLLQLHVNSNYLMIVEKWNINARSWTGNSIAFYIYQLLPTLCGFTRHNRQIFSIQQSNAIAKLPLK